MRFRRFLTLLVVILAVCTAGPSSAQRVRRAFRDTSLERNLQSQKKVDSFLLALQVDHMSVVPGRMLMPNVIGLACAGLLASCNGNNAQNPYLLASLPGVGYEPTEDPPLGFYLRPDEAVVLIGRTPPPAAYFSFRSFIFSKWVEHEDVRRNVFVSLGDPNNMLTVNTLGKAANDPFDRAFVLVVAADKAVQRRVVNALHLAGYPDEIINFDSVSPNIANPGLDTALNDEYLLLIRTAIWQAGYEQAGEDYLNNPPVTVLRVTPDPAVDPSQYSPLPVETLRPRGTGRTEMDFLPEVEELRRSILAAYPEWKADEMAPVVWLEESFPALQHDNDVLGESRDTVYLRNEGTFNLNDDEFLVVYGTSHAATGKATYSNFAVYDACKACPVAGENSRRTAGSALDYVGAANPRAPHVDQLYAWKVARDCGSDPRCTELPRSTCTGIDNSNGRYFVGFRAYVEPATKIGPAFTEIVFDRVMRFSRDVPVLDSMKVEPALVTTDDTPALISFHVTTTELPVTWTATLLPDHGCATLSETAGTIQAGDSGDVSITITPAHGQRTVMNVRLDATDGKGRRAHPRSVQPRFYWPDPTAQP